MINPCVWVCLIKVILDKINQIIKEPLNNSHPADRASASLAFFNQIELKSVEMCQYVCVIFAQFS